jgi:hypothetical protein
MNQHDANDTEGKEIPKDEEEDETSAFVVREKLIDALTPGFQAEFDPDEADQVGAFVEDALSEEDAAESSMDLYVHVDVDADLTALVVPTAANDEEF